MTLNQVGSVLEVQGDRTGALAAYREGLDIVRALAAKEPGNKQWQRDLSVSLVFVVDVLLAEGDTTGALAAYREGLTAIRTAAAADIDNTLWQHELVTNLDGVGVVLEDQGDLAGALVAYREALEIPRALAGKGSEQQKVAARTCDQPEARRQPAHGTG